MGAIGGLIGTAGGVNGTGISGPQAAPIQQPVTQAQVNAGNQGVGNSLASQNNLLAALQAQGGVGNQSQVLNQGQSLYGQLAGNNGLGIQAGATGQQQGLNSLLSALSGTGVQGAAIQGQGNLANQLGGAGGIGAQTGAIGNLQGILGAQQGTAGQLQGIANGTGPNPAQAMLNQQTGENVANQAALMAGQRGAGANVGLLARQAAQQGAATQQQAVGQGATLEAQQQMNAINALTGNQAAQAGTAGQIAGIGAGLTGAQQAALAQQFGQGQAATGQLQQGIGQQFGQGATTVGQQQAALGQNAGIAGQQVGNLAGVNATNIQGNLGNANQLLSALGGYNSANVSQQGNINSANAGLANTTMTGQQGLIGGVLNAGGAGLGSLGKAAPAGAVAAGAKGGEIEKMAAGGDTQAPGYWNMGQGTQNPNGPQSPFAQFLLSDSSGSAALNKGMANFSRSLGSFLTAPSAPDGQNYAGPDASMNPGMMTAAKGGLASEGGKLKANGSGQKAVKTGDTYSNDKVPAVLSEHEIVIPRSVTMSEDPIRGAADFVAKVLAKRKSK